MCTARGLVGRGVAMEVPLTTAAAMPAAMPADVMSVPGADTVTHEP